VGEAKVDEGCENDPVWVDPMSVHASSDEDVC
jgi:hypothetical protein